MDTLHRFKEWLISERAISEGSANDYMGEVRRVLSDADPTRRLMDTKKAPKSRWKLLAILRQWAVFTNDAALAKRLDEHSPLVHRLPRADRASVREPMSPGEWRAYLAAHATAVKKLRCPMPIWATIGIMAHRGLRVGDVLRMSRTQVEQVARTGRTVFIGKGQKRLNYGMKLCIPYAQALCKQPGWLHVHNLVSRGSPKVARNLVLKWAHDIGQSAGIEGCYTHKFRRTVACAFIEKLQGDPLALIKLKEWMGWSSIATAEQYVNAFLKKDLDRLGDSLLD